MGSTDQLPSVSTSSDLSPEFAEARKHLIVALDFATEAEALALVDRLGNLCQWFKVGLELYLSAGNSIIKKLTEQGYSVFLDLKLHDIPNTIAGAVRSATSQGAALLTVHTSGGPVMLKAAADAAASSPVTLLGVTVLTSMDAAQLQSVGVSAPPPSRSFASHAWQPKAGFTDSSVLPKKSPNCEPRSAPTRFSSPPASVPPEQKSATRSESPPPAQPSPPEPPTW